MRQSHPSTVSHSLIKWLCLLGRVCAVAAIPKRSETVHRNGGPFTRRTILSQERTTCDCDNINVSTGAGQQPALHHGRGQRARILGRSAGEIAGLTLQPTPPPLTLA